jgi:ABC-type phosphate transport system substrate-binding protein
VVRSAWSVGWFVVRRPSSVVGLSFRLHPSAFILFLLAACAPPPTLPPPPTPAAVRVLATDLTAPLLLDLAEAYAAAQTNVAVVPVLAAEGVPEALTAGEADLALTTQPPDGLYATPVAYAQVAVVVHAGNPVGALSAAQTQALFAGEVTDWAQVGGAEGPVQPVIAPDGETTRLVEPAILPGEPASPSALVAPTWDAMLALVGDEPGAIGYLPAAELTEAVRVLDQPVELRALVVAAALAEPTGPARDFLAWAQSDAGQTVIEARFEPLE